MWLSDGDKERDIGCVCVCLFVCLCMRPMLCRFVSVRLNEDSSLAKIYFRFVQFPVQLLIFRVHMNQFGVTTNETHATQMHASTLICMATRFPFPHPPVVVLSTSLSQFLLLGFHSAKVVAWRKLIISRFETA